ncbi:MAG: biotin/lipoyl-containing protein, partial [Chloroflexota bacterium]
PGYGFLSENHIFAERVLAAGLTWIGPSPASMATMGNKAAAKAAIADTAVPTIPGYSGDDQSDGAFATAAEQVGFPVMVKAAAGGGGRGMRLVASLDDLEAALTSARSEAEKAFGSPELLLEKAIVNPRHIEVQVFGDQHGNVIHLGERDCSIQRRHQKVVEEAPSPAVAPELRQKLGEAAVLTAKAVDYIGAGTVEFLLDDVGDFYFIEMNTRLQVEHPVTEIITGQDLVAWQLLVAEGQPLPLTQAQVDLNGHAIEVRLYAEDASNQFLPSTGVVHHWQPPTGDGVRVDHGLRSGLEITPFYDAMVAKIICSGETREVARRRLARALKNTAVFGVITNRAFLLETTVHPTFVAGEATTSFIGDMAQKAEEVASAALLDALATLAFYLQNAKDHAGALRNWQGRPYRCRFGERVVALTTVGSNSYQTVADEPIHLQVVSQTENRLTFEKNGLRDSFLYAFDRDGVLWLQYGEATITFENSLHTPPENADSASSGQITAPMPGAVMRVDVAEGDTVQKGQTLLILEAMKMEHTILAPIDGTVQKILVSQGQQMQKKELMIIVG